MNDSAMTGISTLPIGEVVNTLTPLYESALDIPTVMLWGPPGVGKSDGVEQIAANLRESTGRPVYVYDLRLLLFNPVDLRGIPVPDEERIKAIWLRPGVLPPAKPKTEEGLAEAAKALQVAMDAGADDSVLKAIYDPNAIYLLFLDEITAAPPSVQAAAYQLTLNRRIGEHDLPNNAIIIAAGNRVTDKGVAYKMPTPLANRMLHLNVGNDFDSWKDWAIPNGVHQWVLSFLNMGAGGDLYQFDPSSDSVAFATPRSWMFVSQLLDAYKNNMDAAYNLVAGAIGAGTAIKFKAFVQTANRIPSIDDIMAGKQVAHPNEPDVLYALSGALVARATKMDANQLKNTVEWTIGLRQKEFAVLTVRDMMRTHPTMKSKMLGMPTWRKWAQEHKNLIS